MLTRLARSCVEYFPATQAWHVLVLGAPYADEYLPGPHATQSPEFEMGVPVVPNVPGGHSSHYTKQNSQ